VKAVTLRDASSVEVRPIEASDRDLLEEGFERLSPQSRYRRFFSPVTHLSKRQLDYLTQVDHHDHEALVAIDPDSGGLAGVARFVRTHPGVAEPAIVVADDWQARGLGSQLLDALADRAREEGVDCFVAPVLSENRGAIALFERLGQGEVSVRHDGIEVELTIPLGVEEGATRSLRQVLHEVAAGTARPALTFWQRIITSSDPPKRTRNVIVVGVPSADGVEPVADAAAAVGGALGAELHVVAARRFLLDDREELAERTRRLAERLEGVGLSVATEELRGDLAATLIREAVRTGARLIVVDGTEPHASAPLLGSTWDHVTHHAPCAVLVARPPRART
jgi:RimJ/RimL family protein N-acetyltransferase/nucleotide-binding universal stress UspA family protein